MDLHSPVAMRSTPPVHRLDRTAHPALSRLPAHVPLPTPGLRPKVGEAEKIESPGTFPRARSPASGRTRWSPKRHQPCLLRMQAEPEAQTAFRKSLHDPLGLFSVRQHQCAPSLPPRRRTPYLTRVNGSELSSSAATSGPRRRWGLPGSWRTFDRMPCFGDSGGPAMTGPCAIDGVAFPLHVQGRRPQSVISELSTQPTISLSTLHRFGYPHGARLASGWRPPLAGRNSHPQGPFGRFQTRRMSSPTHVISSPFPRLRLARTWHRSDQGPRTGPGKGGARHRDPLGSCF